MGPSITHVDLDQDLFFKIHNHTIDILKQHGFRFSWPRAVDTFRRHGFKTWKDVVYFNGNQVESALESVPSEVMILARDERHNLKLTLDKVSFGLGRGAIYTINEQGAPNQATLSDLVRATKLAQQLTEVEHWQPLVLPQDIPDEYLSLCVAQVMIKYQTKVDNIADVREYELVRLAFGGVTAEKAVNMSRNGFSYGQGTINPLSPLTLTESSCRTLDAFARCGLATQISPMPQAGSTGPCTLLGVVIQQNCEVLAPLVLSQLINPGCPVLYGNMGSGSDMRTMGGSFGSPESRLIELISGRLAKHYGLLSRGGIGVTDSGYEGFQAGAEALLHAQNAMACKSNLVIGMGILGGLMGASLRKLMLDAELVNYVRSYFRELDLSDHSTAAELIKSIPFGSNYLTTEHTLAYCRQEYYVPKMFERKRPEYWKNSAHEEFMRTVDERVCKEIDAYAPPEMDEKIAKEIDRALGKCLPGRLVLKIE